MVRGQRGSARRDAGAVEGSRLTALLTDVRQQPIWK